MNKIKFNGRIYEQIPDGTCFDCCFYGEEGIIDHGGEKLQCFCPPIFDAPQLNCLLDECSYRDVTDLINEIKEKNDKV